jgi:anti-sigma regulatory factor (Ser/Thr protein kinase)
VVHALFAAPEQASPMTKRLGRASTKAAARRCAELFGTVREARAALRDLPISQGLLERASLVMTELATNAVLHAGGARFVRVWYGDGSVRIEVGDGSTAMPERGSPGTMSGRGLLIVSALANAWGAELRPEGKVVWAELR